MNTGPQRASDTERRDCQMQMLRMPDHQNAEVLEIMEIVGSMVPQRTLVTERQGHATELTLGRQSVEAVMRIRQLSIL